MSFSVSVSDHFFLSYRIFVIRILVCNDPLFSSLTSLVSACFICAVRKNHTLFESIKKSIKILFSFRSIKPCHNKKKRNAKYRHPARKLKICTFHFLCISRKMFVCTFIQRSRRFHSLSPSTSRCQHPTLHNRYQSPQQHWRHVPWRVVPVLQGLAHAHG